MGESQIAVAAGDGKSGEDLSERVLNVATYRQSQLERRLLADPWQIGYHDGWAAHILLRAAS
jgi:hypothetical protein